MNKTLNTTTFESFQLESSQIKTALVNGNVYFKAADVCKAFELSRVDNEMAKLHARITATNAVLEERGVATENEGGTPSASNWCKKIIDDTNGFGSMGEVNYINEPAMYYLASRGKSKACLLFTWWLFTVVIPNIQHKGYFVKSSITPEQMSALAQVIADMKTENEKLKISLDQSLTYQTVAEYCVRMKIEKSKGELIRLGKQCKAYSAEHGYEIKKCETSKYTYNSYHIDVLNAVIEG